MVDEITVEKGLSSILDIFIFFLSTELGLLDFH